MKPTTVQILSALAGAVESGELHLALAEEVYPRASVEAAAEAFAGWCRLDVEERPEGGRALLLRVAPAARHRSREVVGECLSFLLTHAVQAGGGEAVR